MNTLYNTKIWSGALQIASPRSEIHKLRLAFLSLWLAIEFNVPGTGLLSRNRTTIGAGELNGCVRDGNRCDLTARGTGNIELDYMVTDIG
jgi:hypothetical protein